MPNTEDIPFNWLNWRAEAGTPLDITCSATAAFTTTPNVGVNDIARDPEVGTAQQLSCAALIVGSVDTLNPIVYSAAALSAPGDETAQTIEPPNAFANVSIAVDGNFLGSPAGRVRATAGQDWFFTILCLPGDCVGGSDNIEVNWGIELSQSGQLGTGAAVVDSELITAFSESTIFSFQARANSDGSISYGTFGGSQATAERIADFMADHRVRRWFGPPRSCPARIAVLT